MRIITPIIVFFALYSTQIFSQDPNFEWAKHYGGPGTEEVYGIVTDSENNVITVGAFRSSEINFIDAPAGAITSKGKSDLFVLKKDEDGNTLWYYTLGNSNFESARSVSLDENDNIYVSAAIGGVINFDPLVDTEASITPGEFHHALLKIKPTGEIEWAINVRNNDASNYCYTQTDNFGNVYLGGTFENKVVFEGIAESDSLTNEGDDDPYIIKLNRSGQLIWIKSFGAEDSDEFPSGSLMSENLNSISTDTSGNIAFCGSYSTKFGATDIAISKVDSTGNLLWKRVFGASFVDRGHSVTCDKEGNVITLATYWHTIDFDPGDGVSEITSKGQYDNCVVKLDPFGNFIWVKGFGNTRNDYAGGIASDENNSIYLTGKFIGRMDWDPGENIHSVRATNYWDNYILKLNENGRFIWMNHVPSSSSNSNGSIYVDKNFSVYSANTFVTTADIDPTSEEFLAESNGDDDFYIMKLNQHCDTGIPDLTITYESDTLKTNISGATYRWYDCESSLFMDNDQQFLVPDNNGSYAVEVTKDGCAQQTLCEEINDVGIADIFQNIQVYPNPSKGFINIDLTSFTNEKTDIKLYSLEGKLISSSSVSAPSLKSIELPKNKGIYFVTISNKNGGKKGFKVLRK